MQAGIINVVSLRNHLLNCLDSNTVDLRPTTDAELQIVRHYSTLLDGLVIVLRMIKQQWEHYIMTKYNPNSLETPTRCL